MAKITVNQELCDGCGNCITPCLEGALAIKDGKCVVVDREVCDGMGHCLPLCPTGALSLE